MYNLSSDEKKRLQAGIRAAFAIPFIDGIEDFIWEAIFAYVKNIPLVDPLTNTRSKRLFDVVDNKNKIGWSIKSAQISNINLPYEHEVVIQRADIFKKAKQLGYGTLDISSPVDDLGEALLKHWYEMKVNEDAKYQQVDDKRVCILLKSKNKKDYVYFEEKLIEYNAKDLKWEWTDNTNTGLQAKKGDTLVFRWYPNQKQFFERFTFPEDSYRFTIKPERLLANDVVELLLAKLEGKP